MTTITSPFLPLAGLRTAVRRSWVAAGIDAVGSALAALLLGPESIDPAVGFRR